MIRAQTCSPSSTARIRNLSLIVLLFPGGKPELDGKGGDGSGGGEGGASEKARVAGGIMQEADSVLAELVRLREWKEEMENT